MKTIILFFLTVFTYHSWASWPKKVIDELNSYSYSTESISDPIVATFWGGFKRYLHWPKNKGSLIEIETDLFLTKKLQVYFSQSRKQNAPLVVFMPGVFGEPQRGLTPLFIESFEKYDSHVLVVPNILSATYVGSYPLYENNPAKTEIAVMEKVLDEILKKKISFSKIHVVAESLGSVVASGWAAHDRRHLKRLTDLTLLWPPLNLKSAMKNFDTYFGMYEENKCSSVSKLSLIGRKFLFSTFPSNLDASEIQCAGEILLKDGFLKVMNLSFDSYLKSKKESSLNSYILKNFESYFKNYRPQVWNALLSNSPDLKLSFWFSEIKKDSDFPVRIMTSQNDFLNFGEDWNKFKNEFQLSDEELVILKWGGHSGAIGVVGFDKFLQETLKL